MAAAIYFYHNQRIELCVRHQQIHPLAVNRRMNASIRVYDNFAQGDLRQYPLLALPCPHHIPCGGIGGLLVGIADRFFLVAVFPGNAQIFFRPLPHKIIALRFALFPCLFAHANQTQHQKENYPANYHAAIHKSSRLFIYKFRHDYSRLVCKRQHIAPPRGAPYTAAFSHNTATTMHSIPAKLAALAQQEHLHLLLAVESGSRVWGFASPDSDYDVRVLYIRPPAHYLCIDEGRDTLEFIEDEWFDVGGWDIRKALRLLRKSNAVLLEWLRSPVVYAADSAFVRELNALAPQYAQAAPLLHHYRGIARNALGAMDLHGEIRLKKWFYVLRPLFAARWAVQRGGIPPMTLAELMDGLPPAAVAEIRDLVAPKSGKGEDYRHRLSPALIALTETLAAEVAALTAPAAQPVATAPLDALFRATLQRVYPC